MLALSDPRPSMQPDIAREPSAAALSQALGANGPDSAALATETSAPVRTGAMQILRYARGVIDAQRLRNCVLTCVPEAGAGHVLRIVRGTRAAQRTLARADVANFPALHGARTRNLVRSMVRELQHGER